MYRLLERCSAYRPRAGRDPRTITKLTLRLLARRAASLETEIGQLDAIVDTLVEETAPELVARLGIGTERLGAPRCRR